MCKGVKVQVIRHSLTKPDLNPAYDAVITGNGGVAFQPQQQLIIAPVGDRLPYRKRHSADSLFFNLQESLPLYLSVFPLFLLPQ